MNALRELVTGVALAGIVAISACGQVLPARGPTEGRESSTAAAPAGIQTTVEPARVDAGGAPDPLTAAVGSRTARRILNLNCESQSADPAASCYRYWPTTSAAR